MTTTTTATTRRPGNAIVIIGILFFVFGFVTWLNGTLIPFLKLACELHTDVQAFFCHVCFVYRLFLPGHSQRDDPEKDRLQEWNGPGIIGNGGGVSAIHTCCFRT